MSAASLDEIRAWPPTISVATSAGPLGISRSYAHELARRGDLPVRCIRVGSRYRVITASLVALLEGDAARETA